MTRSDTEALDEVQLSLSRACEELLSSDAWQRSPSESFGGLKKRLRMIPGSGLPEPGRTCPPNTPMPLSLVMHSLLGE